MCARTSIITFVFLLFSACTALSQLPIPIDIPEGPSKVIGESPAGKALPEIAGKAQVDAPAISAISDVTFPDETLVMAGANLEGARLRIWAEGEVRDIEPLRTAENRLQAIVPKDLPVSTMLIWPVKGGSVGLPIRVNGATAWWCWPQRARKGIAGQTIRVFGKNLTLNGSTSSAYMEGGNVSKWLTVKRSEPYHLEALLPGDLGEGKYKIWIHNGTGGKYGWSEPMTFKVVKAASMESMKTFRVDEFGAKPNDEEDDAAAIGTAVAEASRAGGGIVAFSEGTYNVSRSIETSAVVGRGIHFVGAGMGTYDFKTNSLSGAYTALKAMEGGPYPSSILRLYSPLSSIRDMTVVNGCAGVEGLAVHSRDDGSREMVIRLYAPDFIMENARLILFDARPNIPQEQRKNLNIFSPALLLNAPGIANTSIRNCEFHSPGSGIDIGEMARGHEEDGFPEPSVDYVQIDNCIFRGYVTGWYKEQDENYGIMGVLSSGIQNFNGINTLVENCDFAGADRMGGKMINRSVLAYNTSVRNQYWAHNRAHEVGMICDKKDKGINQGEQFLFHFRHPYGGYFDVIDASLQSVTVNPDDPRNTGGKGAWEKGGGPHRLWDRRGSRVLEEVGTNDHWIVYVSAGKGVGQYRVVVGSKRSTNRIELQLDRPWRVTPDRSSRITLGAAFRQNIIYENVVDNQYNDPNSKVIGALFWFNAFENIIANNRFRNVGYGPAFNSAFRNPCCWNLVRENVMESVAGFTNGECPEACFYTSHYRINMTTGNPALDHNSEDKGWYTVGNIARSNRGTSATTAAYLHGYYLERNFEKVFPQEDAGMMMDVIENNNFAGVENGIMISPPAAWTVLRNNIVVPNNPGTAKITDQSRGNIKDALIIDEK